MRRGLAVAAIALVAARVTSGQVTDTTARRGATISGIVRDSVSGKRLVGAAVQLVATDSGVRVTRSANTDSAGRYSIGGVADGRYTLGFFHPMLDSLGLEPPLREIQIHGQRQVAADLAIRSPGQIGATICGPRPSGGFILGFVRDARGGAPVADAIVTAEWLEVTFAEAGVVGVAIRVADTTRANGWFALCNVPSRGRVALVARRSADSTDRLEVELASGFLRRYLYLGSAGDSGIRRVSGTVVTAAGSRPLRDARVSIGGQQTSTNERGEWEIANVTPGTRVLEVRAIGYYPEHVAVNVVTDAPPVRVALFTMRAMLDTIQVTATRLTPSMQAFEERRRIGMGRYLTARDIALRHAVFTSQLFRQVPGVTLTGGTTGSSGDSVLLRRFLGDSGTGLCAPAFYLDGAYVGVLEGGDLDAFVSPDLITGIEIYRAPMIPGQFMAGGTGEHINCGSIVIWTAPARGQRMSKKRKVLTAAAWVAGGVLVGKGIVLLKHR